MDKTFSFGTAVFCCWIAGLILITGATPGFSQYLPTVNATINTKRFNQYYYETPQAAKTAAIKNAVNIFHLYLLVCDRSISLQESAARYQCLLERMSVENAKAMLICQIGPKLRIGSEADPIEFVHKFCSGEISCIELKECIVARKSTETAPVVPVGTTQIDIEDTTISQAPSGPPEPVVTTIPPPKVTTKADDETGRVDIETDPPVTTTTHAYVTEPSTGSTIKSSEPPQEDEYFPCLCSRRAKKSYMRGGEDETYTVVVAHNIAKRQVAPSVPPSRNILKPFPGFFFPPEAIQHCFRGSSGISRYLHQIMSRRPF